MLEFVVTTGRREVTSAWFHLRRRRRIGCTVVDQNVRALPASPPSAGSNGPEEDGGINPASGRKLSDALGTRPRRAFHRGTTPAEGGPQVCETGFPFE
jgi:hypothetical protein